MWPSLVRRVGDNDLTDVENGGFRKNPTTAARARAVQPAFIRKHTEGCYAGCSAGVVCPIQWSRKSSSHARIA